MSAPAMSVVPTTTTTSSRARVCPGAPSRARRARSESAEGEDAHPAVRRRLFDEEGSESTSESVECVENDLGVQSQPASVASEGGVRHLCPMEQDVRTLLVRMADASPFEVAPDMTRVYTLAAAFIDFASRPTRRGDKMYWIEERVLSGCIHLKSEDYTDLVVTTAAFLPLNPVTSLAVLVEAVNEVLISEHPCFRQLEQVCLAVPDRDDLENGILPSANSPSRFVVDALFFLDRWGFKAFYDSSHHVDINPDHLGSYDFFIKTRRSALWRLRQSQN